MAINQQITSNHGDVLFDKKNVELIIAILLGTMYFCEDSNGNIAYTFDLCHLILADNLNILVYYSIFCFSLSHSSQVFISRVFAHNQTGLQNKFRLLVYVLQDQ